MAAGMEAQSLEIDAPASSALSSYSPKEGAVTEIRADRTCYASASSVFAASGPQGWAELPDDLVRSIIALLGYFRDLLAFVGTCRPWHDLLSAHTSSLQPLLLHPTDCTGSKRSISCYRWTLFNICEWRLADPSADAAASWDNWAIFVSADGRCQAMPCRNPERLGGRSNHIYYPSYESKQPWAAVQLWQKCHYSPTRLQLLVTGSQYRRLESTWVWWDNTTMLLVQDEQSSEYS